MPDIADGHTDFREAVRRAEEASGITRDADGNEQYAEETPVVTPELEGAVPVQASEQPLESEAAQLPEEPAAVTPESEVPATPSVDELQQRLAAAEARLEEKDSFIGRQSGEVGELRKAIEEMQARLQTPAATPPALQITQEFINENPAAAVQAAYEQNNPNVLNEAFEVWRIDDPFAAASWRSDRLMERQRAEFEAALAERDKRHEETLAPIQQSTKEDAETALWTAAFDKVKADHPDFMQEAARLLEEVVPQHTYLIPALQSEDPLQKAGALAALYTLDRAYRQVAADATEEATEAAAARAAAGVVTGQPTAGQPTEEKTTEELERERYISRQRSKPSLTSGWTGRS